MSSADSYLSATSLRSSFGNTLSVDDKIQIFDERVDSWQLKPAEAMLAQIIAQNPPEMQHGAYALIAVIFSYYEMIGNCLTGKNATATEKFVAGFKDVYPALGLSDSQIRDIYGKVRCGMYHVAYTKIGVLIDGNFAKVFTIANGAIEMNPHLLVPDIRAHFTQFVAKLKSKADALLVQRFQRMFKQ